MTTLAFILSELFPLYCFRCNFVPAPYLLVYYHDTVQICWTGLDNVLHTRMTTLAFILSEFFPLMVSDAISCSLCYLNTLWYIIVTLSELFPLDCLICKALYFGYFQDYFHENIPFCRRGHDNVSCITIWWPSCSYLPYPPPTPKDIFPRFGFFVKLHWLESSKLNL